MHDENFVVNLDWNKTLTKLYSYLSVYNEAIPTSDGSFYNTDLYNDIAEAHMHFKQDRFFADNVEFNKLNNFEDFNQLLDELDLDPRVCWGHVTKDKRQYVPHRERYVGSVMFPISGCNEKTVTSFAHYVDPQSKPDVWYWHEYIGREEIKMFEEDEIAYSYSLLDKPILFNNNQFHQVENFGNDHRKIVTIHFKENIGLTWKDVKQKVKSWN